MAWCPGKVAGRIGKGAYGGVWQAKVLEDNQDVVVKVVFPDPDLDPEESAKSRPSDEKLSSFRREIEVMSVLGRHPNVVSILGITSDSRVLVLEEAMIDLHQMVKRQRRSLSLGVVRRWSRDLISGVAYLHGIQIIHRDLKPSNLLIFNDMTLKLGDFGLAREADPEDLLAVRREICTLWYRAPELIMGDTVYSSKIDVWSAGCIMLEMLVGRCAMSGRVEDVCKCPKTTHFNFNSDQLAKIFRVVGTPTDKGLLSRMQCHVHFESWPVYSRQLEQLISNGCSVDRLVQGDKHGAEEQARQWKDILAEMLVIDPAQRAAASNVVNSPFWQSGVLDGDVEFPKTPVTLTRAQSSEVSKENNPGQQCMQPLAVSTDRPKLTARPKRSLQVREAPNLKVHQNIISADRQRRVSLPTQAEPFSDLQNKETTRPVRRAKSEYSWKLQGADVVALQTSGNRVLLSRAKSTSSAAARGAPLTRVPSSAKSTSKSLLVLGGFSANLVAKDTIR